jgi:tetratricopeptide (TPR) repeat protein
MNIAQIPFDMSFTLDEFLRERPNDKASMSQGVGHIKEHLDKETDPLKKATMLTLLGVYSRIMMELVESEEALEEALGIYKEHNKKSHGLGAKLRLAVTYTWKKEFGKGEHIFLGAIEMLKDTEEPALLKHLDYAYLHLGKSKFEQQHYGMALDNFVASYELKIQKGDMNGLDILQQCIDFAKEKMNEEAV